MVLYTSAIYGEMPKAGQAIHLLQECTKLTSYALLVPAGNQTLII
jgi:hypothetical protein